MHEGINSDEVCGSDNGKAFTIAPDDDDTAPCTAVPTNFLLQMGTPNTSTLSSHSTHLISSNPSGS